MEIFQNMEIILDTENVVDMEAKYHTIYRKTIGRIKQ